MLGHNRISSRDDGAWVRSRLSCDRSHDCRAGRRHVDDDFLPAGGNDWRARCEGAVSGARHGDLFSALGGLGSGLCFSHSLGLDIWHIRGEG